MTNSRCVQVLVVGAGPTGLFLAGQLARRGIDVRIVDRAPAGCRESRALAVHARTLEVLHGAGLAEELIARGRRVAGFTLWDGRRRLARFDFRTLDSPFPFLLDVPQYETEQVLRRHLASLGVQVEQSTEVTGVAPGTHRVDVMLHDAEMQADYVVGCDGAHSIVRRSLGMTFDGHSYSQEWLLADLAVDWDRSPDDVHVIFNPAGRATVFMPLPDQRWRLILYFAAGHGHQPTLDDVAELVQQRVPGRVVIADPTWLATFRTHRRSAPGYRRGRVFLAGDAVHIHSPAGGQGLNIALQDAHNLAGKLTAVLAGAADESLLDSYETERAPVARQVLELSHNLVRLSSLTSPWQRAARNAAIPLLTRLPGVRARAARRIAGYPSATRTGDRAGHDSRPDATMSTTARS